MSYTKKISAKENTYDFDYEKYGKNKILSLNILSKRTVRDALFKLEEKYDRDYIFNESTKVKYKGKILEYSDTFEGIPDKSEISIWKPGETIEEWRLPALGLSMYQIKIIVIVIVTLVILNFLATHFPALLKILEYLTVLATVCGIYLIFAIKESCKKKK